MADASTIPLQAQQVNPVGNLSQLLGVANAAQQYRAGNISNESNQALLTERTNLRALVSDPRVQDAQGNVDPIKFATMAPMVAPTLGGDVSRSMVGAQTSGIENMRKLYDLSRDQHNRVTASVTALLQDPAIQDLSKTPTPSKEQLDAAHGAITDAFDNAVKFGVPKMNADFVKSGVISTLAVQPQRLPQTLTNMLIAAQNPDQQTATMGNQLTTVPTAGGTQFVQTNRFAPGGAGNVGAPYAPPNQFVQTSTGIGVGNPASGEIKAPTPIGGASLPAPTVALPPGETADTSSELQKQRTEVQTQLRTLPERMNIYREIVGLTDSGTLTGSLGSVTRKLNGILPPSLQFSEGSDVNTLGKFLEQEAARSALAMGPHTNAGLESARAAGGTLQYDDKTLGKIARLAAANSSAIPLYDAGLNRAIQEEAQRRPGVDPIFAKREFDQKWANAYDPRAMRLKNAVDNGDQAEVQNIVKEVGGLNSKGANTLHLKLQSLLQLSGAK